MPSRLRPRVIKRSKKSTLYPHLAPSYRKPQLPYLSITARPDCSIKEINSLSSNRFNTGFCDETAGEHAIRATIDSLRHRKKHREIDEILDRLRRHHIGIEPRPPPEERRALPPSTISSASTRRVPPSEERSGDPSPPPPPPSPSPPPIEKGRTNAATNSSITERGIRGKNQVRRGERSSREREREGEV